jgi:hypothetical protein
MIADSSPDQKKCRGEKCFTAFFYFQKSFQENRGRPRKRKSLFSVFLYSQKDKNAGCDMIPAKPRPETPSSGMGTAKVQLFHQTFLFFLFLSSSFFGKYANGAQNKPAQVSSWQKR